MSIRRTNNRRAFTLLEMMVVLVIIGLLGGIVAINLVGAAESARADTTRQKMKTIAAAVDGFNIQHGVYPQSMQELVASKLVVAEKLVDAWKRDILYFAPAPDGQHPYLLVSLGKNGQDDGGQGDDIYVFPDSE